MKKHIIFSALLVVTFSLLASLSASVSACSIYDFGYLESDFIIDLRSVESFVEAELISMEEHKLEVVDSSGPVNDLKFQIGKTLRGKVVPAGTIALTDRENSLDVGDKLIIGLTKLNEEERKERSVWNNGADPGDYALNCKLEKRDDGSLEAILSAPTIVFSSFDEIVQKIEGKLETKDNEIYSDGVDVLFYRGLRVYYATATKAENIYAKRSLKSSKILVLQPYDYVLKIGETDVIGKERWEKVLLADGNFGYMPEGALKICNKFPGGLESAKLAAVIKTSTLKDRLQNDIRYARVRKGTATIVMENPNYNAEVDKGTYTYMTLRAGPQELGLAPIGNIALCPNTENAKLSIRHVDIFDVPDSDELAFSELALGTYYVRSVAKRSNVYASTDAKSGVILSVGKGDRLLQMGTAVKKNGKSWIKVVLAYAEGYIVDDNLDSKFKIEIKAKEYLTNMAAAVWTSSYTYALEEGELVLDKNVVLRKGCRVFVDGYYITIDDQRFYRVNVANEERYVPESKIGS